MSLNASNRGNYVDSALFLSPPGNWGDVVGAMKPGAHLLLFSSVKSHHVETIAAEDNGLEIRDTISYVFHDSENGKSNVAMKLVAVARKPLEGTVAENVLRWGTGGLNIDESRISGEPWKAHKATGLGSVKFFTEGDTPVIDKVPHDLGRWPANIVHDNSTIVLSLFPNSKGQQGAVTGGEPSSKTNSCYGEYSGRAPALPRGDSGSAARFFYVAPCLNDLCSYLIRLVTPSEGTILTNCDLQGLPNDYNYVKDCDD